LAAPVVAERTATPAFFLELGGIVLLALGVRLLGLHHPHFYDELFHLLAAQSLVEHGQPVIAAGEPYLRARGYTELVAAVFRVAGEGMTQMRAISVVAGTLELAILFAWLRAATDRVAAWSASLLLALDPDSVSYSTAGRFYILQALCVLVAVVAVWWSTLPGRPPARRIAALAGAALALAAATYLQVASLVGAGMLAAWGAGAFARDARRRGAWVSRRAHVAWLLVAVLALLAAAWAAGLLAWAWRMTSYVPPWAVEDSASVRFYYWALLLDYPMLVALLPLLAVLAVGRWPREGSLAAVMFAGVIAYHSIAAFKGTRFVLYVHPYFFALSGMGIAAMAPVVRERTGAALQRIGPALSPPGSRAATGLVLATIAAVIVLATPAFVRTRRFVARDATSPWAAAESTLRPLAAASDVVVAGSRLPVLYYVGRLDVVLERPDVGDPDHDLDGWDRQVGKPVIGSVPAFARFVALHPSGLVVTDSIHWRVRWAVRDSLADWIEAHLQRVPLTRSNLLAFRWGAPASRADTTHARGAPDSATVSTAEEDPTR
jgi:hypothetical protein